VFTKIDLRERAAKLTGKIATSTRDLFLVTVFDPHNSRCGFKRQSNKTVTKLFLRENCGADRLILSKFIGPSQEKL
jgi:hypothetical protein